MKVRSGARLRSQTCDAEVIVVRAPAGPVTIQCGGHDMAPVGDERGPALPVQPGYDAGTMLGKRYAHDPTGIELLCTKGGRGALSVDGAPLLPKDAKPLPSSD